MVDSSGHILAFDCAGRALSVSVADQKGNLLASQHQELRFGHAARLMPAIEETMAEAQLQYKSVSLIATTTGPGGFTGLRVGITTAKTLAQALSISAVGISTFLAHLNKGSEESAHQKSRLVIIDSHRKDLYCQWFDHRSKPIGDAFVAKAEVISKAIAQKNPIVFGNGRDLLTEEAQASAPLQSSALSEALIKLIFQLKIAENPEYWPCEPVYIRAPDVTLPENSKIDLSTQ